MMLEDGKGPDEPRLVRGGARDENVNAEHTNDGDVTHQNENASSSRPPLDASTRMRDHVVDVGDLRARNRTARHRKIVLGESSILLPEGKIYAMFDVSEDIGRRFERTKYEEIAGIDLPPQTLLPKWIASTLEKIPPGQAVGYLPLKQRFEALTTIQDYLTFLGRLHKMSAGLILQRFRALSELLQLPHECSRFIDLPYLDMRRVDLAAAFIHSPSLLIVEEPTWEQDASSREKIWSFFTTLTRDEDVAVLLLTADPEEAGHADIVGFFNHGRLIAEDSPDRLLQEFQCGDLGEVFRKLQDGQRGKVVRHSESGGPVTEECHETAWETKLEKAPLCKASQGMEFTSASAATSGSTGLTEHLKMLLDSWRRILLLYVYKNKLLKADNYRALRRITWFAIVFVSIHYLVFMTVGSQRLAVVKSDGNSTFAEAFLDSLPEEKFQQVPYSNRLEALASMERGETFAMMEIGQNFSAAPQYRLQCTFATEDNQTSHNSTLDIDLETVDQETRFVLLQNIFTSWKVPWYDVLEDFRLNIVRTKNASHAQVNLEIRDPVYGSRFISRFEFLAPTLLLLVPFVITLLVAATQTQININVMDTRLALAGVKPVEVIVSTLLSLLLHLALHAAVLLVCVSLLYWASLLPLEGSPTLVIRLILEKGLQGMAVGLTIALPILLVRIETADTFFGALFHCSTHLSAMIHILASLWFLSMRPDIIRSIRYYVLPRRSIESLFYIMFRGWGLEEQEVAIGFTERGQWIAFFPIFVAVYVLLLFLHTIIAIFVVCRLLFRYKRRNSQTYSTVPKENDRSAAEGNKCCSKSFQMSNGSLP